METGRAAQWKRWNAEELCAERRRASFGSLHSAVGSRQSVVSAVGSLGSLGSLSGLGTHLTKPTRESSRIIKNNHRRNAFLITRPRPVSRSVRPAGRRFWMVGRPAGQSASRKMRKQNGLRRIKKVRKKEEKSLSKGHPRGRRRREKGDETVKKRRRECRESR